MKKIIKIGLVTITALGFSFSLGKIADKSSASNLNVPSVKEQIRPTHVDPIALQSRAFVDGYCHTTYYEAVKATGGSGVYDYAIAAGSAFPDGVYAWALDAGSWLISGTPTKLGSFSFSIVATDVTYSTTATANFTMYVHPSTAKSGQPRVFLAPGNVAADSDLYLDLDGTIFYTIDGTDPTLDSAVYTGPIRISHDMTVKIIGYNYGFTPTDVITLTYHVIRGVTYNVGTVNSGTAPVDTKEYIKGDTLVVKSLGSVEKKGYLFKGWKINGDTSGTLYQANDEITIQDTSFTFVASWEIIPLVLPAKSLTNGTYLANYSETITATGGSGSYTYEILSGSYPIGVSSSRKDNDPTLYLAGSINIFADFSFDLKVTDDYTGDFVTRLYTINVDPAGTLETPSASLASGVVEKYSALTLSTVDNSTIYYAINGSAFQIYSGPITIEKNCYIDYYATRTGYRDSDFGNRMFAIKQHSINYVTETSNTLSDTNQYEHNDSVQVLGIGSITKEDKLFLGWSLTENGDVSYHEGDIIYFDTSDITLYAIWVPAKLTITFMNIDGSEIATKTIDYNTTPEYPETPTREGYTFACWYTDLNVSDLYWGYALQEDTTLYGVWSINVYTISFDTNGADGLEPVYVNYGETPTLPEPPTKEGYNFAGWYIDSDFTVEADFTHITSDMNVYAKWAIKVLNVSFDSNGGSAIDTVNVNYGSTVTAPNTPTKDGYTFAGWYTDINSNTSYDFSTPVTSSFTLVAKWAVNSYTLTIDINGQTTTVEVTYGSTITLPDDPTKDGYTFEGWYIDSGCTIPLTETNMPSSPITIYAKFVSNASPFDFVLLIWIIVLALIFVAASAITLILIKRNKKAHQ